jgi:hypothetical protein
MVVQMLALASSGADPVLCLEPLHIPAAQAELQQLLLQQAAAQPAASGPLQTSRGQPMVKRDSATSTLQTFMAPAEAACASRLIFCSNFVVASHKLMWWLQHAQQRQLLQPSNSCHAEVDPPVILLAGHDSLVLRAVATTAAAALAAAWVHVPASRSRMADCILTAAVQAATVRSSDALPAEQVVSGVEGNGSCQDSQPQQLLCVLLNLQGQQVPDQDTLQLLRRWSLPERAAANGLRSPSVSLMSRSGTVMSSGCTGQLGHRILPVCLVVIGTPEQVEYALLEAPSLQQRCLQLCVPWMPLAEQLASDCKEQLLATCGSFMADHIRAEKLQQQQLEQQQAGACSVGSSLDQDADSKDASALAPAARHLADSLAVAISKVHQAVHKACSYPSCDGVSTAANMSHGSSVQAHQQQLRSPPQEADITRSSQLLQCDTVSSVGRQGPTLPMWKPFDVLRLLPVLLKQGQQPLIIRRALLTRCLATMEHTMELVLQQLQQGESNMQQRDLLVDTSWCKVGDIDVGHGAAIGDSNPVRKPQRSLAALRELLNGLQQLQSKWKADLHQVGCCWEGCGYQEGCGGLWVFWRLWRAVGIREAVEGCGY